MLFQALYEAAQRNELLLMEGGMCRYHLRRDGQLTIGEIIVIAPGQGIGTAMLERLKQVPGVVSIFAKCPYDLPANEWYNRRGFKDEGIEATKSGRWLRRWRLTL